MEFVLEFAAQTGAGGQSPEFGGRELMLLQFAEQLAELLGNPGRRALGRNNFNPLSCRINRARSTITRPSSASKPDGIETSSASRTNRASRSNENMFSRV